MVLQALVEMNGNAKVLRIKITTEGLRRSRCIRTEIAIVLPPASDCHFGKFIHPVVFISVELSAFNIDVHMQSRNYFYDLQYIDRSEGFHTDLGFVPRVNIRQFQQFAMRRERPDIGFFVVF